MSDDDLLRDPNHPDRPQHPDFWRLSEIILELDGKFSEEGMENFDDFVNGEVDLDSIMYMAMQRALRLRGRNLGSISAIYVEAFLVGRRFERRYAFEKRYGTTDSDLPKDSE